MKIEDLLNKRVLLKLSERYGSANVQEFKVVEISPSANWIKLMTIYGDKYWRPVAEVSLVEVLRPLNGGEPHPG